MFLNKILLYDSDNGPVDHPDLEQMFRIQKGKYLLKPEVRN